jgi:hypothetical protein
MKTKLQTSIPAELTNWPFTHPSVDYDVIKPYYGSDSEKLYKRNLRERDSNWLYFNEKINYTFNNQGLRMKKNIEDIKSDYILFSGTSLTMGVGINENRRFSDIVSEQIGLDYINFSGPIYSIKLQVLSFFGFLKRNIHLPKIFVIEYPYCYANMCYSNGNFLCYSLDKEPSRIDYPNHYKAFKELKNTDFFLQEAKIWQHVISSTCDRLGIKLIEVSFFHEDPFILEKEILSVRLNSNIDDINYCFGRDYHLQSGHPGIGIHKEMSDVIISAL